MIEDDRRGNADIETGEDGERELEKGEEEGVKKHEETEENEEQVEKPT